MDQVLQLLLQNGKYTAEEIGNLIGKPESEVSAEIAAMEKSKTILGYQAVVDPGHREGLVAAFIEVKLTPEREGGFDRIAERISKFDEVWSCYLMSGGYDLIVVVRGSSLHTVAEFISEKLSTIEGVLSTATHFHLKTYKQAGFLTHTEAEGDRLPVTP
ncbi:MAG: Lrp/AsnC family transcriptional regulator [Verrucomicrobiota bacterium]